MKLAGILKPEYFYQPQLALRRFLPFRSSSNAEFVENKLPWGLEIRTRPNEEHGQIISTIGVIDLAVTETIFRLASPGELAVDVGANIGYMTAVFAACIGSLPGGSVLAIEAHPEIFEELKYNVENWRKVLTNVKLEIQQIAISDERGKVTLGIPNSFATNRGLAAVLNRNDANKHLDLNSWQTVTVDSVSLDDLLPAPLKIGVLKLDVEGHEISVLKGAKKLLKEQRIRDCVFEEHREYPTDVTRFFEDMGYTVFRIQRQFFGPRLLAPDSNIARTKWQPTSFLATQQPERALNLFQERGWKALKKY